MSKKGSGQQDGQKEKDEIHSLQKQLAALKEITVGGAVIRALYIISCNDKFVFMIPHRSNGFLDCRWSETQLFTCTDNTTGVSPYE